ncbi:hypothetical protein GEMRC1_006017 [Eukaryota sp. GEM-RC1]
MYDHNDSHDCEAMDNSFLDSDDSLAFDESIMAPSSKNEYILWEGRPNVGIFGWPLLTYRYMLTNKMFIAKTGWLTRSYSVFPISHIAGVEMELRCCCNGSANIIVFTVSRRKQYLVIRRVRNPLHVFKLFEKAISTRTV